MELSLLKKAARQSVALMVIALLMSVVFTKVEMPINSVSAMGMESLKESVNEWQELPVDAEIVEQLGDTYIRIPYLSEQMEITSLEDVYMEHSVHLTFDGLLEENMKINEWIRCKKEMMYEGMPIVPAEPEETTDIAEQAAVAQDDVVTEVALSEEMTEENVEIEDLRTDPLLEVSAEYHATDTGYTAEVDVKLDALYAPQLYQGEQGYYLKLAKPHDVYDKILVIDAGHGGKHPGTVSNKDANSIVHLEKDVNLAIVLALKKMLDQEEIKVYYTRLGDDSVYLRPRVELANDLDADFFISVHNNALERGAAYGTEVLYNELNEQSEIDSKTLATICLDAVTTTANRRNRGLRVGSEKYIIGKSKVPVALIEVGFLTDPDDLKFLLDEEGIRQIAEGIYKAVLRAYEEKDGAKENE